MLERKLIAVAERLHSAALRFSLKSLNKRSVKAERTLAKQYEYAERISEAALLTIAKAGAFYQEKSAAHGNTMREVNALSNEIENRLEDLGIGGNNG